MAQAAQGILAVSVMNIILLADSSTVLTLLLSQSEIITLIKQAKKQTTLSLSIRNPQLDRTVEGAITKPHTFEDRLPNEIWPSFRVGRTLYLYPVFLIIAFNLICHMTMFGNSFDP